MSSKTIKAGLKRCKELIVEKNYDSALKEASKILELDADNYNARIYRGKIWTEQGIYHQAERDFLECIKIEPDKPLGYQGLSNLYMRQELWQLFIGMNCELIKRIPANMKLDVTFKTLDICRYHEYYPEWCAIVQNIEDEKTKFDITEKQWDSIPFLELRNSKIYEFIRQDATVKKVVFCIWLGNDIQVEILNSEQISIKEFEENGRVPPDDLLTKENVNRFLSIEFYQLLISSVNSSTKENIVSARTIFQKFEKFDFIFSKRNLRGSDVDERFFYSFNSKNGKDAIHFFLLEQLFYYAEVPDLELAREILAVQKSNTFDLFRLKLAVIEEKMDDCLNNLSPEPAPGVPAMLQETEMFQIYLDHFAVRLKAIRCEVALMNSDYKSADLLVLEMPKNSETFMYKGLILYNQDEFSNSLKFFLKSAKLAPSSWKAFFYLGKIYTDLGDTERGVKCLKKSLSLSSRVDNIQLICQYVTPAEALQILLSYETSLSNHTEMPYWFQFRYGLCLLELGNADDAIKQFQKLTRKHERNSVLWECLAEAYVQRGSFNTALKAYQRAGELCAEDQEQSLRLQCRVGQLYLDMKEVDLAIENFDVVNKTSEMIVGLAEAHLEKARSYATDWLPEICYKHLEKTIYLCKQTFEKGIDFDSPLVWKLFSDALMETRNFEKKGLRLSVPKDLTLDGNGSLTRTASIKLAISGYLRIIQKEPTPYSWSDLATAYYCIEDFERAILSGKKSIELMTDEPKLIQSDLWYTLGLVAFSIDPGLCQHSLVQSLKVNHENSRAWTVLGLLYMKIGDEQLSHQALTRAQAADPDNSHAWGGLAQIADNMNHPEVTDLFRHSSELINAASANAHSFHIAKNIELDVNSQWYERNVKETNGLTTAATNIVRLTNVIDLSAHERSVYGLLTEKVGLNRTALKCWSEMEDKSDQVTLGVARLKAKLGEIDEALEIISGFDDHDDPEVNTSIGYILSLAGYHEIALEHYLKAHKAGPYDHEVAFALGLSALRAGELNTSKQILLECTNDTSSKNKIKAIKALGVIAFLTEDDYLCSQIITQVNRLPDGDERLLLKLELEVRQCLIRNEIDFAIRKCTHAIHRNPSSIDMRALLAKIMLKYDSTNPALSNLLPVNLNGRYSELFTYVQLTSNDKNKQRVCARNVAKHYHMQPWNHKLRSSFTASIELEQSAESMKFPNESVDILKQKKLKEVQRKYLLDLLEAQSGDQNRVWNISGLARLNGDLKSDEVTLCLRQLEEVDEELHIPILATLATMSSSSETITLGDINLDVENVLDLLEANETKVPSWLPLLLGSKAAKDKKLKLALRSFLLPVNGKTSQAQSYNVMFESIRIIESLQTPNIDNSEILEIGHLVARNILESNPTQHVAVLMQGILYAYGGEYKRGIKSLTKLLASNGTGLWRSVTRYYLMKLMKARGDNKLQEIFAKEDKADPLFKFMKSQI